jgi:hypothetical protein
MNEMVVCPVCGGTGEGGMALVRRANGCTMEAVSCRTCQGKGTLPADYGKWADAAAELDAERKSRDLSLGEFARAIGVPVAEASDARLGHIDPRPYLERLRALTRGDPNGA